MLPFCSSLGQGLNTTTYVGEISFAIIIAVMGLVLFALLIGNMQVSFISWAVVGILKTLFQTGNFQLKFKNQRSLQIEFLYLLLVDEVIKSAYISPSQNLLTNI